MAINFPDTKNPNDTFSVGDKTWIWDGTTWKIYSTTTSGIGLGDLSVSTASAGTAALSYNNTTGVFTYTPPDLSGYITSQYTLPTASTTVLGGVKVDGSTINIDGNGVISGSSSYTLPTASTTVLGGVKIDGTTITINNGVISGASSVPTSITVVNESTDATCFPLFSKDATGNIEPKTVSSFKLNSQSGQIEAGSFKMTGGTSSEFLKADGSIDSSTYSTFSGSYTDLTNKPTLFSGSYNDLTNKPTLFSGSYNDLTNKPTIVTSISGLSDVTISSASNGEVLKYNGTAWVNDTDATGGGGGGSSTTTTGSLQSQMDSTYLPKSGASPGFTDLTTSTNYPNGMTQTMPTYSNDSGGSAVATQPVSYAFDGRDDTFCDVSSTNAGGWVRLTFDNPVGLKNDGNDNYTGQIDKIVLGFDGQVQPGYNGATSVSAGTFDGTLREVAIYDSVNTPLSGGLINLYFKTNNVGDKGRLYYVILSGTASSAINHHARVTFSTTDISLTSAGSGHRPFIMHDSAGAIHLTPADVNAVVAVKTDLPRQIVLPMGSLMTPGDTITVIDVGTGALDREDTTEYPHANGVGHPVYNYNSGNASMNPIFIYPDEEEGIQGTNIEPWSGDITNGSANNSGTGWFLQESFHGMPFAINRNGGSIKLIYCGVNYGWRILP